MSRKGLCYGEIKDKITISVKCTTLDRIDDIIGNTSRSAYVRGLIEADLVSRGKPQIEALKDVTLKQLELIEDQRRMAIAIASMATSMARLGKD